MLKELLSTLLIFINVLFIAYIFYYVVYKRINNINHQIIYVIFYLCPLLFFPFAKNNMLCWIIGTLCSLGIVVTTSYFLTKMVREYAENKEQVIHPILLILSYCFFATIMFFNILGFVELILIAAGILT